MGRRTDSRESPGAYLKWIPPTLSILRSMSRRRATVHQPEDGWMPVDGITDEEEGDVSVSTIHHPPTPLRLKAA